MIVDGKMLEDFSWTEEMGQFLERMNFKAGQLGMTSSSFANPYGGCAFGWNESTCMDLLRLGIHAYSYPYIMDVMSMKGATPIHVYGEHERDVVIEKDFQQMFDETYVRVHGSGQNPHIIYGGKGGGWSAGEHKIFAWMAYANVCGKNVLAVVANVSADRSVGRIYRLNAIIEVLDICEKVLKGESIEGMRVTYADYAAATLLPEDTPTVLLKKRPIETLYTQGAEEKFNPASISKVLAVITAYDIVGSNQEMYRIEPCDTCNDSTYWAFPGDIETVETGLYPILINSNGSNTLALARHCGLKIMEEKRKFGII